MNKISQLFKSSFSIAMLPTVSIEIDLFPRKSLGDFKSLQNY